LRPGCEELAARIRRQLPAVVWRRGAEGDESAAPRPKTATVERREASVPRHGTQGASLGAWRIASWDARRLARRLAYRVMIRPTGVPPSTRTFLGAPPTPHSG